ncbi:MAG: RNA 3'-terminal phosphate cyclase [Desulfovibrio sp.]|jgi:RNA 3'-terminal phosphate cyclase (ATP)|nr:RNA 3'-terminal phosphate cyclase [Desulfovibrio sp.]
MSTVHVDGSLGEGGGQVLRASLALSMALGRPFRMTSIRANRPKPGLKRQHLTCVRAAQQICGAEVAGDSINSTEICFAPGAVRPGNYCFDIGSGGSCTMVLQALVPPLLVASGPSRLTVTGGTHVPFAPPFEFLRDTLFPWLAKLGPRLSAHMDQPGFMQVGGGSITVEIDPVPALQPLDSCEGGAFVGATGHILLCNLGADIAKREKAALLAENLRVLGLTEKTIHIETKSRSVEGLGNAVLVTVVRESGVTVCTGIGQLGVAAKSVARHAADRARSFLRSEVPVEKHLADQLLVPMALAGSGTFLTEKPSLHTKTCMAVLPLFMDVTARAVQLNARAWRITLS